MRHYNELSKYLTSNDLENSQKMAIDLKEDITFFKLYMNRNKKSCFSFNVTFSKGFCNRFLNDLWKDNYQYFIEELDELCMEYMIVRNIMETLDLNNNYYSNQEIVTIYNYFLTTYDMKLEDYVTDFINCSISCTAIINKLKLLVS